MKQYVTLQSGNVPYIRGAGGGGKGGSGQASSVIAPNSLLSTDVLVLTVALGEGPVYRINHNGPQDIEISDSAITDLLVFTDGATKPTVDNNKFYTSVAYGTLNQTNLQYFGEGIVVPQLFSSAITLRKGNINTIPVGSVIAEPTSAASWDSLRFNFMVSQLSKSDENGNVNPYTVKIHITVNNYLNTQTIYSTKIPPSSWIIPSTGSWINSGIQWTEKTDIPAKKQVEILIPEGARNENGYIFTIEKESDDSANAYIKDDVSIIGWDEVRDLKQAYPRTALIGYAIKSTPEHSGGVPTFTSLVKGLLVKVPSNYNQPILSNGEIDWRELELPETGTYSYTSYGYMLQNFGGVSKTAVNPTLYIGSWDGTFVYSWTQNPVWILYDLLTNTTYGLGIPAGIIDKYKFYQVARYCDACDNLGRFVGVSGVADGSFRHKPRGWNNTAKQNQFGIPNGFPIKERRFVLNISLTEQEKGIDVLNRLASLFRGAIISVGGKISLAVDMPEEFPVMVFNDSNIKKGSFTLSGIKESEIITGVDVSYVNPTNHYKRESFRVDTAEANDGTETSITENITSLDLTGVTRRGQAMRMAQYMIASSRYQRRNISFTTSTDAIGLAPGEVISVATKTSGIGYGYGGKIFETSILSDTNVYLEHFTFPAIDSTVYANNTYPLTLRVIKANTDLMSIYVLGSSYGLRETGNTTTGADVVRVKPTHYYNTVTRALTSISDFTPIPLSLPERGDLWALGEWEDLTNVYTNKAGKLFKITSLSRETDSEEITISAQEYISNVYIDSETFISYEPTAYNDILSPFSVPPTPNFDFYPVISSTTDGSVVVNGVLTDKTDLASYSGQRVDTEYFVSYPTRTYLVNNTKNSSNNWYSIAASNVLVNNTYNAALSGKNGFTTKIGAVDILCNNFSLVGNTVVLTLEGFATLSDINYNRHLLNVNNASIMPGADAVYIPLNAKTNIVSELNFVGYQSPLSFISRTISSYNTAANTITLSNIDGFTAGGSLYGSLPRAPFYVTLQQILVAKGYANNSFYLSGDRSTRVISGSLTSSTTTIPLEVKPRYSQFVRVYIDNQLKATGTYTVNTNLTSFRLANVVYTRNPSETTYRIEVDYYTVPAIEPGDKLEIGYDNVYVVANTSFQPGTATYSPSLTSAYLYRIALNTVPSHSLAGGSFINVMDNPVGTLVNVSGNAFNFVYDTSMYPGTYKLGNNQVYTLELDSSFTKIFLSADRTIPNLPVGTTTVKARNRNSLGRVSAYTQRSVEVYDLPIKAVDNLLITESLYTDVNTTINQTVSFDAIENQQVTDYAISMKVSQGVPETNFAYLTDYSTVKVSAKGVDSNNQIRYTFSNVPQGPYSGANYINVRVTPLNGLIQGVDKYASKAIIGDVTPPPNIISLSAVQQDRSTVLTWEY